MLQKRSKAHWLRFWPLYIASFIYLALVFTNVFTGHHTLFNLEPYPDGLWYVGEARSLAQGQGLVLTAEGGTLNGIVPPVYSIGLAAGFLFTLWPAIFYLMNMLFGLLTLAGLFALLRHFSTKNTVIFVSLLLYVLHGYILWVVGVPMAENIALTIFVWCLWLVLSAKVTTKHLLLLMFSLGALLLTKYAYIGTVVALGGIYFVRLVQERQRRAVIGLIGLAVLSIVLLIAWFSSRQMNPFDLFGLKHFGQTASIGTAYYSFDFVVRNALFYVKTLFGAKSQFLWLSYPLTSIAMPLLFLFGIVLAAKTKTHRFAAVSLGALLISQFPLLLLFYVADARYMMFALPLYVVGSCFAVQKIVERAETKRIWWAAIGLVLIAHLVWQASFLKMIVATNWLQRSRAWQYETTQVFNVSFRSKSSTEQANSYVITALPPFFVSFYQVGGYHLLPLSPDQEFLNKKQYMWGDQVNYQDLTQTYDQLLRDGKNVYISNAYLTAQHEFIDQYQDLTERYQLKVVAQDCYETCNLYEMKLKPTGK